MEDLHEEYYNWMYSLIEPISPQHKTYRNLTGYLDRTPFTYFLEMDGNREEDGIDLRYHFGREKGYSDSMISANLDNRQCSMLEMMVALAIRCEEQIMDDPDIGDRTAMWFWGMIDNLGLGEQDDFHFDETIVASAITRLLNRNYAPNGKGGLFTVKKPRRDMRVTDIWYQMCWYLTEFLGGY